MVFWAVLGVAKTAVGLGGAARFVVGVFGAATTTAAAPAAAATMLASRLAQILFTVAGSAVTAVAAKLQQRRRNSLPPPEPVTASVHTISLMSAPELEDPWLLALALAIIILALSRRRAPEDVWDEDEREAAKSEAAKPVPLDRLRTTIYEGKSEATAEAIPTVEATPESPRAVHATGLATPAPLFMKATLAPTVQLTGGSSPLARRAPPSEDSPQSSELAPSMGHQIMKRRGSKDVSAEAGSDHNRERRNSADVTNQLAWLNKQVGGEMSPPITPPVLRKTPNGSPVTTPEHSPATQLRLGKWVDGLKDNAKVKLGESVYKVSPFSQARLSI